MSSPAAAIADAGGGREIGPAPSVAGDLRTVVRQIGFEQRAFWRTPQSALFTFALPVLLLIMFNTLEKGQHLTSADGVTAVQYFIPSMLAYGVMSASFVNLAITTCFRRESGVLKRWRGSPLPAWAFFASVVGSSLVIVVIDVVIALVVGRLAFGLHLPHDWAPLVLAVVVGGVTFAALGLAISSFVPNAEAAPAIVNLPYLVLVIFSGAFFPFPPHSSIQKVVAYFPVSHFIKALFAPFDLRPGVSPWAWHDLVVVAVWGAVGLFVTFRRFRWEPTRR